jgi:hypothetical protein
MEQRMQRVTLILDRSAALRETFGPEANWWVHAFVADLQALVLRVTGSTAYVTSTIQIATEASEGPLLILSGDTPHLPESRVRDAYTLLDSGTDVVIGLCDRGSWYLLGIRHLSVVGTIPLVSEEVRLWLSGLHRHGVRIAYLPLWFRIVYVSDLVTLSVSLRTMPEGYAPSTRRLLGGGAREREWGA